MNDPRDAELVWRSPMMQPGLTDADVFDLLEPYAMARLARALPDLDQVEANRHRYRSGYDVETGRIWPAA